MPARTAAEKLARKEQLQAKREARRLAKEKKEKEKEAAARLSNQSKDSSSSSLISSETGDATTLKNKECFIISLSDDCISHFICFLTSRDIGALVLSCKPFSLALCEARVPFLMSRLNRTRKNLSMIQQQKYRNCISMCSSQAEARAIIQQSYGGGETNRILPKGKAGKQFVSEFVTYARFLEEAVMGYGTLQSIRRQPVFLPPFVNGRFVSVSPEHSLSRVGGGALSGAGGSGVASWGVGKRGQLGHGKRQDEAKPKMLLGGIGYGIRIVQVSAGGGLVRVAHSLLLTSSGRVMSFGTGQYGALGHGFSAGKQLPDALRPRYIEALAGTRCICVSAGEIHSGAVTEDGDVYTWGDGFCGQLGHADKAPQTSPIQVTHGGLEDECISHLSCGARHTIAVTEDGEVFSWGLGHFGVLGRAYTPFDHEPEAALMGMGDVEEDVTVARHPPAIEQERSDQENEANSFDDLMGHLDMIANLTLADSSDQCIPKVVNSLEGIKIVGASAGHRHTLLLDEFGSLYSCGSGSAGCLGLGDNSSQMYPMRITYFDTEKIKIMQMSAGVDVSMAVSTTGDVYAWGKTDGGRIGLGLKNLRVLLPRQVKLGPGVESIKAVDVECGYVHSLIVGLNGTVYQCGDVGLDGTADSAKSVGEPTLVDGFNIWHRVPEPKEFVKVNTGRWKKYGQYEIKGRQKMMSDD